MSKVIVRCRPGIEGVKAADIEAHSRLNVLEIVNRPTNSDSAVGGLTHEKLSLEQSNEESAVAQLQNQMTVEIMHARRLDAVRADVTPIGFPRADIARADIPPADATQADVTPIGFFRADLAKADSSPADACSRPTLSQPMPTPADIDRWAG